jgi:hypothetical protein
VVLAVWLSGCGGQVTGVLEGHSLQVAESAYLRGPGRLLTVFVSAEAATGQSGLIKLETMDAKRVSGSFKAVFGNEAELSGTFDAPLCDAEFPSGPASCD